jgi:acyl-CoA thioester hydrolase
MTARRPVPEPADFRFSCPVQMRFRDLDAMGHVNNAVYLTYFEVGREGYFQALGFEPGDARTLEEQFPFVVAEATCRFLAPARIDADLQVHVRTTAIGGKSFTIEYLVTDRTSGRALACGQTVQVYYDYGAGRPAPVPTGLRARLETLEGRVLAGA